MFTGIAEGIGEVLSIEKKDDIVDLEISHTLDFNDLKVNDSICCSGICLTVIKTGENTFCVQMVPETIDRSNAKYWEKGSIINLERAMLSTTRMGGHYLQGHVDGLSKIENIEHLENSAVYTFSLDKKSMLYIVEKGYIGIDGLSLTIAKKYTGSIDISIIPHTLNVTNFKLKSKSDYVNVEFDIVSKYVENFMKAYKK